MDSKKNEKPKVTVQEMQALAAKRKPPPQLTLLPSLTSTSVDGALQALTIIYSTDNFNTSVSYNPQEQPPPPFTLPFDIYENDVQGSLVPLFTVQNLGTAAITKVTVVMEYQYPGGYIESSGALRNLSANPLLPGEIRAVGGAGLAVWPPSIQGQGGKQLQLRLGVSSSNAAGAEDGNSLNDYTNWMLVNIVAGSRP